MGNSESLFGQETGAAIYKRLCASCHGAQGEGTDESYPHRLIGDRSLGELTEYIDKSMPEDNPKACTGEEAKRVAEFVYHQFYSKLAQERNRPARWELSRLTVRQYRNAVTDLVGSFREASSVDDKRGLRAEYYKSRRTRGNDRVIERIDSVINVDFGEEAPDKHKDIKAEEFSIKWQGSIFAPETGDYEFNLKTANGARLWVNDTEKTLVDAWVRSGTDKDHRASIYLLGGRTYPLQVEVFKFKEKTASISLEWKPPGRAVEVVPARFLLPSRSPALYVVSTPFPPDDRSIGYDRGNSISKSWDQATTDAAVEAAAYVVDRLNELAGVRDNSPDRKQKIEDFCRQFVERAFRHPLTEVEKSLYVKKLLQGSPNLETGVKRVVLLALKSPRFLYREIGAEANHYHTASRLSFAMWDSLPDKELLAAAGKGELTSREQVVRQAERMLKDPRTRAKLGEFFVRWLKVDHFADIAKDRKQFPEFTDSVISHLRTSLDLFIDDVVWGEASDFRQLLLAKDLHLNGPLAKLYGFDLPADAPFQKVPANPKERAGVLSHPYLMAGFAYTANSSPIHRGVFIARSVLGRSLRPPPEAVAPLSAELHASLSTRERVALQTNPKACQSCHAMINPLGFSLENFDALGRFRKEEKGKPIDASGAYRTTKGNVVRFEGVRDLAEFLASSEETHAAFVNQLYHFLVKQPIRASGPDLQDQLLESFASNGFNIRKLVVEIVVASALPGKPGDGKIAGN